MSEWNPIETAPKDGTQILGWDGVDRAVIYWRNSDWNLSVTGSYAEDADFSPKQWLPLPSPPNPISTGSPPDDSR